MRDIPVEVVMGNRDAKLVHLDFDDDVPADLSIKASFGDYIEMEDSAPTGGQIRKGLYVGRDK